MKIGFYTPYSDNVGGGEKYILTIAESLSKEHQVEVLLDKHLLDRWDDNFKKRVSELLDLDLSRVSFVPGKVGIGFSALEKILFLRQFDLFFYVTDGSIFFSGAKRSIVHIQMPFEIVKRDKITALKLKTWDLAIYNSHFSEKALSPYWKIKSEVVYPPVDVTNIKPLKKKKMILSVGRFQAFNKVKKHEVMIEAFKKLCDGGVKGYSLELVGSIEEGNMEYLKELKQLALGYEVNFHPNLSLDKLHVLQGESQIYWHAMGYGEEKPWLSEHFGIAVVEAMAGGEVPIVINKGGIPEIVENGKSGLLWNNIDELVEETKQVIADEKLCRELSEGALRRAEGFSKERFVTKIRKIVG